MAPCAFVYIKTTTKEVLSLSIKVKWKTLIYQLYPAAWPGGLRQMAEFLPRIKALGADYVWLSPCYESPWIDGGYDISDYESIHPRFGTLSDFDDFVRTANSLGLQVLMDLVLNHTSTEHIWFKKSVERKELRYLNYYHWEDRDLGWHNIFDGGPAFEWNPERRQFYLHLFHPTQADLNWDTPAVLTEFQKIIDFWTLDHGVGGFRLDVAQFLGKIMHRAILPWRFAGGRNYFMKPQTLEILHELFDHRRIFTVAEAGSLFKSHLEKLAGENGPLSATMNVMIPNLLDKPILIGLPSASRLEHRVKKWSKLPYLALALESHDLPRATSRLHRYGEEIVGMMTEANPRILCLYQGQEIGTRNPVLSDDIKDYSDIQTIMQYHRGKPMETLKATSRDNARVPLNLNEYDEQETLHHWTENNPLTTVREHLSNWKAQVV